MRKSQGPVPAGSHPCCGIPPYKPYLLRYLKKTILCALCIIVSTVLELPVARLTTYYLLPTLAYRTSGSRHVLGSPTMHHSIRWKGP